MYMVKNMDFYAYYLYKGYALYAESEDGLFRYNRPTKRWRPVEPGWEMADNDDMKEISAERAARFF